MARQSDVLIVGGGAVGTAIARELSLGGRRATILERGEPCREASWAAAGALVVRSDSPDPDPLVRLKLAGLALYPEHCRDLTRETGIDTGYRETGGIDLFTSEEERAGIEDLLGRQEAAGISAERVSGEDLANLEPRLNPDFTEAVLYPGYTQVRTPWYARALLASALRNGAELETHTQATDVIRAGDRVIGVRTDRGEFFADRVVLAAGPWSALLGRTMGIALPGVPVKGQILLLHDPTRPVRHIVHHGKTYITPRDEGRMIVGSTEEWVGFERRNTVEAVHHLLERAKLFFPCLEKASIEKVWHGFRPLSIDGFPYIGEIDGLRGVFCATGHYRSGIILAPITARIVSRMLADEDPGLDISPFSPSRIASLSSLEVTPNPDYH